MSYIGNTNTTQGFIPAVDFFSGNASTTVFTLSRPVASVAQVEAVISNVVQDPGSAYTVSGNTITFTSAPPSGTNNIYVRYTSPITQVIAPGQGTVGTTQLQNGLTVNFADGSAAAPSITNDGDTNTGIFFPAADTIAFAEGGAEAMRIDSSGNVGIGTSSPNAKLNVVASSGSIGFRMDGGLAAFYPSYATANQGLQVDTTNLASGSNAYFINAPTGWTGNFISGNLNGVQQFRIDQAGNLAFNSGYGSSATAYGCRAWVNFNGTGTVAIRGSANVSSITDNGTGGYTVNFTNAMPDANYCTNVTGTHDGGSYVSWGAVANDTPPTTSAVRTDFLNGAGTPTDVSFAQVSIIR